ncbi:hypothetical protein [Erythrobacter sp. F6033]|uniref:hypothetical protein n=1 Tax=Erythrobacter sp. F6033 TaxID=2926401 RepID=UPI001FF3DC89|nr:hypothetical protein [Erythrobacter sp. F6033]MCK0129530.1 hypothetical protein [Erythrobacter sp. F6033]
MVITAILHSTGGANSVLGPILAGGNPHPDMEIAPTLLTYLWHSLSAFMILSAAVVVWPETPRMLILAIGVFWIGLGVADIITSKFAHPGWIPMGIAGVLAIIGAYR